MALPGIKVEIDPAQLAQARALLDGKTLLKAMRSAVAETTKFGVTIVKRELRDKTFISKKYYDRAIASRMPSGDPPVGVITVSRQNVPLIGFKVSVSKSGGITAKIYKGAKGTLKFAHAFQATLRSGHVGYYQRTRHISKNTPTAHLTPTGFAPRLTISELVGPPAVELVQVPEILAGIQTDLQDKLRDRLASKITYFASK